MSMAITAREEAKMTRELFEPILLHGGRLCSHKVATSEEQVSLGEGARRHSVPNLGTGSRSQDKKGWHGHLIPGSMRC